jgi:hypothetical protein
MSLLRCACGAPLKDGSGFCAPCRESLALPPVPQPVKRRWSEKERMAFRQREALVEDLRRRIAALPDRPDVDPFAGLERPMCHTGAGGLR